MAAGKQLKQGREGTENMRKQQKLIVWLLAAILCFGTAVGSEGAVGTGQGDGKGQFHFEAAGSSTAQTETAAQTAEAQAVTAGPSIENVNSSPTTTADTGTGARKETVNGVTYYIFDGKRYVVEQDWGTHYLTGFSPEATGGIRTASGKNATSNYTAASTRANLGKVILVQGESGTSGAGNIHRYDGVYKCEDTGGTPVEYGTAGTGGTPVVDLFFDTEQQAHNVSGSGWINARIYILKEVK